MPKKYNIHVEATPPRFHPVGRYTTVQSREDCAGSCRDCVKNRCIYDVHQKNREHTSAMPEPEYLYECESCLRCVQECVRGTLALAANPDYPRLGDDYWTPEIITTTWRQAEKGAVPVSGAGYRGPFAGQGFDAMWTDMSEIVRPTRDGIHGREYINTMVQLSRRPLRLEFENGELLTEAPPALEIPLPVLFQPQGFAPLPRSVLLAAAEAAQQLDTLLLIRPEDYEEDLEPYLGTLVPCLTADNFKKYNELINKSRMMELAWRPGIAKALDEVREINPALTIAVGITLGERAADIALELAEGNVDTLHFYADSHGNEPDTPQPRFLRETIREIHTKLVEAGRREKVNLVFSGGIALAEHLAKAVICGADAVAIDRPLLVALECRLCRRCEAGQPCPIKLDEIELQWGSQRLLNLMGAWRNQLIEVMGAMGIREARRLRGEVGRAMWFEDLERETFGAIFGAKKAEGVS